MSIEFKLPELGEGIASADIANVLVSEGDEIQAEQNVLELETDKAVVELPCPHAGRLSKLHVKPGDTVKPGQLLMTIESAEAGQQEAPAKSAPAAGAAPAAKTAAAPAKAAESKPSQPATAPAAGGTQVFTLPELGEGIASADIANVLIAEGDEIRAEQNVLELETDKAVVELPSPFSGKVVKLHVKAGDTVKPGDQIMTISAAAGEAAESAPAPSEAPAKSQAPAAATAAPARQTQVSTAARPDATTHDRVRETVPLATKEQAEDAGNGAPAPAGPATRRLARELGVDLHQVKGSGPGGRITAEDVHAFVRNLLSDRQAGTARPGAARGIELPPLPDFTQWGSVERVAMNKIAKTSAQNLSIAWQQIPHVTQHELADVTELEAGRKRHSQNKQGVKITMTVLAIKAVVAALRQFPQFNASLDTETNEVIEKHYYNIGVAVDTEYGLVVPVIKDVNQKSILEIARELDELATKARERKLALSDFQGGTFTITNLGGIGGTSFTPIVNWPEVAILGMSRSRPQYVIRDGKPEIRLMLPLSLSYDHRVINGADACRFIVKVAGLLADPSQLLIES